MTQEQRIIQACINASEVLLAKCQTALKSEDLEGARTYNSAAVALNHLGKALYDIDTNAVLLAEIFEPPLVQQ